MRLSTEEYLHLDRLSKKFGMTLVELYKHIDHTAGLISPSPSLMQMLEILASFKILGVPKETACSICALNQTYRIRSGAQDGRAQTQPSTTKPTRPSAAHDPYFDKLAQALGKNVTPLEAREFLEHVQFVFTIAKRCNRNTILRAVRACRERHNKVDLELFEIELRRLYYGYRHDPDLIREIPTPMGGKK